jgi:glycosyltransferase involved in cell wall biosynthesis
MIVQNLPVPFDRRVWQEATSLREAGYNVAVICPKKKMYKKSREIISGVEIYRYPLIFEASRSTVGYLFEFAYCWLATLLLSLRAYLNRPFQVIHACNPPDTFFALALLFRPLGVRFVFDHHDLSPEMYLAKGGSRNSLFYRGLLLLERWTFKTADLVIAVNNSHKDIALKRGALKESRIVVVRSGPKLSWATHSEPDQTLKREKRYLVVYLGEMCAQDGIDYLLRAINHYRYTYSADTLFALVGGGPEQERMEEMAAELQLGDCVQFTGRISDEELWKYLATADLCVDPDPYSEWSNMSTMNKVIEYMAYGKAIVSFDLAENRHSAQQASLYVKPNDIVEFSRTIRYLIENEEMRSSMAQYANRRFIDELAWERSNQILVAAYSSILGGENREMV